MIRNLSILSSCVMLAAAWPNAASARIEGAHLTFGLVYDCSYTTSHTVAAPDVIFNRSGTYRIARHHRGNRLVGNVRTGEFTQRHNRIRFRSGPLQPPPGVEASYFDTHHLSVEIWQLKPAWVPWDCFSKHSQKLEFH
jgi:hypothetical protein